MRTKEYLVAVRARDGALGLTTMLFHDEARPAKDIPTGGKKPSKKQAARKEPDPTPDLMDALERTLAELSGGGNGRSGRTERANASR